MSFGIALSGLNAASSQLDVVANNIANVNTTGFKSSRANFSDVFAGSATGGTTSIGSGVKLSSISQQFGSGSIDFTQNNLDFAIKDEGFFVLQGGSGNVYSRAGAFNLDNSGFVVDSSANRLQVFPPNAAGTGFVTGQTIDLQLLTTLSSPVATTEADIGINLPGNESPPPAAPFDPTQSDTYNYTTSTTVYDSLGASHFVDLYYVK
ncbi:MAG: flagellar hook-basal body complex protein, partial [Sinobacterium sp.]|nr:flagellar hook-basal body complex protein [Sinobacterium sp.]